MVKAALGARILLGLLFTVFGLAGLFQLLPVPPNLPEAVKQFMAGAMATRYLLPLVKGTESVCGLMLLANFWAPLALVALVPITVNIVLFHLFTSPDGLPMGLFIAALQGFLIYRYWDKFRSLLTKI